MDASKQLHASRVINAPASTIFAILADPNRHGVIDGSGMLRGPHPGAESVTAVGQTFRMRMHHPQLGDYTSMNTITSYEQEARIGWAPSLDPSSRDLLSKLGVAKEGGHTFTYDLRAADGGGTVVTETYDWSGVEDPNFAKLCPLLSEAQLSETLERIAKEVE
jgi:hypothetical protein